MLVRKPLQFYSHALHMITLDYPSFWLFSPPLFTIILYNKQCPVYNLGHLPTVETYWSRSRCPHEPMRSHTCIGMYSKAPCTWPHSCRGWGHKMACSPWWFLISEHSCMSKCPRSLHSQPAHENSQSSLDVPNWIPGDPWKQEIEKELIIKLMICGFISNTLSKEKVT